MWVGSMVIHHNLFNKVVGGIGHLTSRKITKGRGLEKGEYRCGVSRWRYWLGRR